MTRRFESTSFWQRTLATQVDPDQEAANRARLRAAYEGFRDRAAMLAGEIAIDLPEYTVHDVTHLDALWEMAQLIAGDDYPLNSAEAFVLGGAFLIHDLGMGLAAYPEGKSELRKASIWDDSIAAYLRQEYGRQPTLDEIKSPPSHIENLAMRQVLRELHAKHAERLALISWKARQKDSPEYFLIDDPAIRNSYGPIIGKLAHSHWWSVEQLAQRLPRKVGALGGFPNSWTVDPVKLACILRTADASHLDERRAPGFLAALRKPVGVSASHWLFQEKLYQPRLESNRLVYTSKSAFSLEETFGWWTCFDTLQVVDHELRQVDDLLVETDRPRLAARGVLYADDSTRMARLIETSNWLPIDTRIKVGDVAKLVATLGGEKLYGRSDTVPLRELIQNASDAVRARRLLEGQPRDWGSVTVRSGEDSAGRFIEVDDIGIGMSVDVLTGPFLDFGASFWGTPQMHRELPGLESKGFASVGQFGIGFYSVFMWGDRVQIVTRRAERARDETLVLEFHNGLGSRPVLRRAEPDECLLQGGTRVRVWLRHSATLDRMLDGSHTHTTWTLEQLCAWLCPALDVNLYVERDNTKALVVGANDWESMSGRLLVQRLWGPLRKDKLTEPVESIEDIERRLQLLRNPSGAVVGRACVLYIGSRRPEVGVVTVGGFRSCGLSGVCGVLVGNPYTAARNIGVPVAASEILRLWASEQATIIGRHAPQGEVQAEYAGVIRAFAASTQQLDIAETALGWKSADEIAREIHDDEVLLVHDAGLHLARRDLGEILLHGNVMAVSMGIPGILQTGRPDQYVSWPLLADPADSDGGNWRFESRSLEGAVIEAIAAAWGVSLDKVLQCSQRNTDEISIEREIGRCDGKPVVLRADVITKPLSS